MKRIISILALLLVLAYSAEAHGGKTDGRGGHRDNYNQSGLGSYHYHCNGHPPHLHDDGVCPYEYKAPSSYYSYNSSSNYKSTQKYNSTRSNSIIEEKTTVAKKEESLTSKIIKWILILIIGGAFCVVILEFIWKIILKIYENIIYKSSPSYILKKYEENVAYLAKEYIDLQKCYNRIEEAKSKIVIPDNFEIGMDDLPREKSFDVWGKQFTVYTTAYGKCMHKRYNCSGATFKHHVCNLENNFCYSYCLKCYNEYPTPNLDWFYAYKDYKKSLAEYSRQNKDFTKLYEKVKKQNYNCNKMRFIIIFSKKLKQRLNNTNKNFSYFELVYKNSSPILFEKFKNRYNNA